MQIAVVGLGKFGAHLAETLHTMGGEVIAIDDREEIVEDIKDRVTQAVCLDATDERALRAIGVSDLDAAVVAMASDIEASIMATTLLRRIGVTRIIARATSTLHARILIEVGASQVIRIEEQMAEQTAKWIIAPEILQQFSFASGYSLVEVRPKKSLLGQKVIQLKIREQYNLSIAAILKRYPTIDEDGKSTFKVDIHCPPDPEDIIERDDILALVGLDSAISKFTRDKD